MSRDPSVSINLSLTTPVGPQTRVLATTQALDRVERLRYHRRSDGLVTGPAPDAFIYASQVDVATSTVRSSTIEVLAGTSGPWDVSIVGGEYQADGGLWDTNTEIGLVDAGSTLRVRHTSSAFASTATVTTVTVGSRSVNFTSVTAAASGVDNVLLEDGTSNVLLEDGSSLLLKE